MSAPSLSPSPLSYAAVLRTPYAARTFGAGLVGRLSYGIVFLSLVLAVTHATGSYTTAGAFVACFGLTSSVLSPVRARLLDRHGPRRALPPMATAYAVLLAAIAAATWRSGAPAGLLWVLAATAGGLTPPLGPLMRTLWGELLADPALRRRAFSLDTVVEELLFVTGPLVAGVLATVANPALGVAVSAVLVVTGSLLLVASPAVRQRSVPVPRSVPVSVSGSGERRAGAAPAGLAELLYRPITVVAAAGLCVGAVGLFVVAFAQREGHLAAVAWIEAALAAGSAAGGLAYGSLAGRLPAATWLPLLAAALGTALGLSGLAPNLSVLMALVGLAGLFVAPALTTAYLLADAAAPAAARMQAGAWLNTAFNLGSAAGAALAGPLLGGIPLSWCFALTAGPALAAALVALGGRRGRRRAEIAATPVSDPERISA